MKTVTKLEAASRQLETAIRLFFSGGDSISIHTLAASAANVFADVSDRKLGQSWRSIIRETNKLSERQLKEIIHREWNFVKHADHDTDSTLEFDESTTDHVSFVASLECGEVKKDLSHIMEVFQIWYIAAYPDKFDSTEAVFDTAQRALPDLSRLERSEQIRIGAKLLDEKLREYARS